ncbi:response regulator [Aliterella atlantica]|uniref:Response regulator receiver protein n=1 Tax=Aliterella atlantica CENA595 TaxID=1618023 RepID=A0A0D8ZKV6_9CYAN|nr:response regulator [Aliterella atlantica]KJH69473.1 response regulator receiver protein [Aliterella atlantica CENA595]
MIGSSAEIATGVDRILVVDDLPDNCFLLQTILESEGYSVEVADSGHAALESIASHPPDLVLFDIMMPGMNGFEVTRRLRQNPALPFIPILLVTGYSEPTPADGFDVGADGFIRKPIDFDDLLHQIQTILQPRNLIEPQK